MKHNTILEALICCLILNIISCSSNSSVSPIAPDEPQESKQAIKISTEISSRATDNGFEAGDCIGIYVAYRNADGSASALKPMGNYADNIRYTYSGIWTPDKEIYWKDDATHADFYLYYPYTANITNANALAFNTKADQQNEADYKASDLLIGKTLDVAPTDNAVMINARHAMSQAIVKLAAGNGFTDKMLESANIKVSIDGVRIGSTANIATGDILATGNMTSVQMLKTDEGYKAIIVPQAANQSNLITVDIDNSKYYLQRTADFKAFKAGKSHKFTITLSKTTNGVNVGITKWEDDGLDYGGTAEQD